MISIIIPVYKNSEMFFTNLRQNKEYFKGCEVIIMNDNPDEKISLKIKEVCPEAIVKDNKINLGFSSNVNEGMKIATGDYIVLLNSDVILFDDTFKKAVRLFEKDKELFALSFAQVESDNKTVGSNRGFFQSGMINHGFRNPASAEKFTSANFWAEGGSAIFRKELFLEFGGFDPLYNPFYWEDVDLSYRAWKMGFKIRYLPAVKIQHFHESTIGKYFSKSLVTKIAYRNQFIFNWKNLTDNGLLLNHLVSLPMLLLKSLIGGNRDLISGFFLALGKLPKIMESRSHLNKLFIKSDEEILNMFL